MGNATGSDACATGTGGRADRRPFVPRWYRRIAAGGMPTQRDRESITKTPRLRLVEYRRRLAAEQAGEKRG